MLHIQLEEREGYTICRPKGELDAYTVGQFRESLAELSTRPKLLIDMSDAVSYTHLTLPTTPYV